MKRHGPAVHFKTPSQDAASAPGFAPNGLSIYTRSVAHGGRPKHVNESSRSDAPKAHVHLLHHQLVAKTGHNLDKLRRNLAAETDPVVRAKLERNAEIAARFLRRLLAERMRRKRHAVREH